MQRPLLQTRVDAVTHPSQCTENPYSHYMRRMVMFINEHLAYDHEGNVGNMIGLLRYNYVYPCSTTVNIWERLQAALGRVLPCRRTGNREPTRMIGQDLVYLAIYRLVYMKALIAEINAFLYTVNIGNPFFAFYAPSQISNAEALIGLSRKKGSTTAYQALFPVNLEKRWNYWNYPYPLGIADIHRSRVIDLDECGMFLETTANRSIGKAYKGLRVRDVGPYQKSEKWNLLLAVCGEDPANGNDARRWADIWLEGGTTVAKMLEFVQHVLDDIGPADPENFFVFTMDNLNSHRNDAVIALIHVYGHGVVFRAPYWPVDGAIEFIFNSLQTLVRARLYDIRNSADLVAAIYAAIQSIDTFGPYFINVGFRE